MHDDATDSDSKDVQAAAKGKVRGKGLYFPLAACQKFGDDDTFENGVFLGPIGHLTFKGEFVLLSRHHGPPPWGGWPPQQDAPPQTLTPPYLVLLSTSRSLHKQGQAALV